MLKTSDWVWVTEFGGVNTQIWFIHSNTVAGTSWGSYYRQVPEEQKGWWGTTMGSQTVRQLEQLHTQHNTAARTQTFLPFTHTVPSIVDLWLILPLLNLLRANCEWCWWRMMVIRKQRKTRGWRAASQNPFAFYKVVSHPACTYLTATWEVMLKFLTS